MKRMIVDTANLLFRAAAAHGKYNTAGTPEEQAGLAMHVALNSLNKHFRKVKPDQMVVTFEGSKNWRKEYTRSEKCLSKKGYKANRVKDKSMEPFFELMRSFEELARKHTSIPCLSNEHLEGDDLFAGYVQLICEKYPEDEVYGISGDKDFAQLLEYKNFILINPDNSKPRTLLEVCGQDSAEYFMFEKAFRGDTGDNVMSAYPRVQKKRLLKCLSDEYELTKIMNETWSFTDPETKEETIYRVGDLYEENQLLMNLKRQPDYVRKLIDETLQHELNNHGKFSLFHFSKFCGKYGLKQIADNAATFAEMFNTSEANTKAKAAFAETQTSNRKSLLEY